MKVLHVITNLRTGGAEKLLVDSIPRYIARGIVVDLLLLNGEETVFKKQLEDKNVRIFSLGKGSVYNPLYIFKLIPYLKKYDIVHVHLFPTLYWVSIAKMISFSKVKLIFTEHNTFNNRLGKPFWKFFDKRIYFQYEKIVSITSDVDKIIKKQLLYKKRNVFSVITNGINLDAFNFFTKNNSSQEINSKIRKIIQVSSFDKTRKDQKTLIEAINILPCHIQLLLVGDGKDRKECEDLVLSLALSDRVKFLGVRDDVPKLLSYSDIVVQSSLHEGFGLAALEGMAAGKPVIASNVPGLNSVVGGAGLLFDVGNYKSLADLINDLLSDQFYYNKIAGACYERAKIYSIDNMVDKYISLYKEVLEDRY